MKDVVCLDIGFDRVKLEISVVCCAVLVFSGFFCEEDSLEKMASAFLKLRKTVFLLHSQDESIHALNMIYWAKGRNFVQLEDPGIHLFRSWIGLKSAWPFCFGNH